jgi:hypothetical protein
MRQMYNKVFKVSKKNESLFEKETEGDSSVLYLLNFGEFFKVINL